MTDRRFLTPSSRLHIILVAINNHRNDDDDDSGADYHHHWQQQSSSIWHLTLSYPDADCYTAARAPTMGCYCFGLSVSLVLVTLQKLN